MTDNEVIEKVIKELIIYESFIYRDMLKHINLLSNDTKLNLLERYQQSKVAYKMLIRFNKF